jgi:hypothetical protein
MTGCLLRFFQRYGLRIVVGGVFLDVDQRVIGQRDDIAGLQGVLLDGVGVDQRALLAGQVEEDVAPEAQANLDMVAGSSRMR